MKLQLGCGKQPRAGWTNLDRLALPGVDVVWDCEILPLPFGDNTVSEIYADQFIEHIKNLQGLVEELYRISKLGARWHFRAPHASNPVFFSCPDHVRPFTHQSFNYYLEGWPYNFSSKVRLKVKFYFQWTSGRFRFLNPLMGLIPNAFPDLFERLFCWIYPMEQIIFKLEVVK